MFLFIFYYFRNYLYFFNYLFQSAIKNFLINFYSLVYFNKKKLLKQTINNESPFFSSDSFVLFTDVLFYEPLLFKVMKQLIKCWFKWPNEKSHCTLWIDNDPMFPLGIWRLLQLLSTDLELDGNNDSYDLRWSYMA